jgi:hypothetical protein
MIQLTPQLKILLAYKPPILMDFRKGIDGLVGLCRDQLSRPRPDSPTHSSC